MKQRSEYKLLLVEDSAIQLKLLSRFLASEGYQVLPTTCGREALAMIQEQRPDLIISDLLMPQMSGFELCDIIKRDRSLQTIPVILLTSLSEPGDILQGLAVGGDSYVVKPYDKADLLGKVERLLEMSEEAVRAGLEEIASVEYKGEQYDIHADNQRIIHFLLTTYENAIEKNKELVEAQIALQESSLALETQFHQLQDSEQRFSSLVELIPDVIYRIDVEGNFIYLNSAVRQLGYEPDELIGQHFSVMMLPFDAESVSRSYLLPKLAGHTTGDKGAPKLFDERRTGTRATRTLQMHLLRKGGAGDERLGIARAVSDEMSVVEINGSGFYLPTAKEGKNYFLGTVGVVRDITERKHLENSLREYRGQLEDKVKARTWELAVSNEALTRSEHELSVQNSISSAFLTIPDDEMYAQVLHNIILPATDSKCGLFGYIDEQGALVCPSMTPDVWDKCETSDKRIVFPRDSWINSDAGWAKAMLNRETMVSNTPSSRVPKGHIPMQCFIFVPIVYQDKTIGELGVANKESDYDDADVSILEAIALHIAPLLKIRLERDQKERQRQMVADELREANKGLEETMAELKATQQYMIQSEKLSSLGTLAAGVAHEMNNPIMGIINYVEFAQKHIEDERGSEMLLRADKELRRVADIVKGMLTFSSSSSEKMAAVDVGEAFNHAQQLLTTDLRHQKIDLEVNISDDLPKVLAKLDSLEQVFLNLLMNARDALKKAEVRRIKVDMSLRAGQVVINICDSGPGIAENIRTNIFDPFFTTKSVGKGTGLGLYISRNLVKGFNGELSCERNQGSGACFVIKLPSVVSAEL